MSKLRTGFALALSLLVLLNACVARTAHVAANRAPAVVPRYCIDLEPGWRVRVVTPILKGGGYRVKTEGEPGATTLKAGAGFLGYEVACCAVKPRAQQGWGGSRGTTARAVIPRAGRSQIRATDLPVRVSEADHDMAVVAANKRDALDPLTVQVRANADGIAVTPEVRTTATGA